MVDILKLRDMTVRQNNSRVYVNSDHFEISALIVLFCTIHEIIRASDLYLHNNPPL